MSLWVCKLTCNFRAASATKAEVEKYEMIFFERLTSFEFTRIALFTILND